MMKLVHAGFIICAFAALASAADPCAPDCEGVQGSFPNPTDCTKYYQCAQGVAVPRTCPDGTYFNPTFSICDHPEDAGCTADPDFDCGGTTTEVTTTSAVETTEALVDTTTVGGVETTVDTVETTAPVNTTVEPIDTTAAPVDTTAAPVDTTAAPVDTTAAPVDTTAAPVDTTAGPVDTTAAPVDTTAGPVDTTAGPVDATAAPVDTTAGPTYTTAAPVDTTVTTVDATVTTVDAIVTTVETTVTTVETTVTTVPVECIPPCPSPEATYPNPRDCSSFFQCSNDEPLLMTCYPGLYFNPASGRCDFPENMECTAGPDAPCVAITVAPRF
ncbi:zonadhesin [Hyalella azteca]|uniref:Zonadhesin n=1 Tax=Hyalella azteca TaxID=294128 RepID=A0A8B7PAJ7_HYAAZ|nr:zonadhesin [Hyalella azteca]